MKKARLFIGFLLFSTAAFAQGAENKLFDWLKYNWQVTIITVLVLTIIIAFIKIYNTLVRKQNEVDNAFAGIDVFLKKRYDLLPNLIEVVKKYTTHEKDTLERVTEMRTKAGSSNISLDDKIKVENQITQTMGRLLVTVENYPDLKANQNFLHLQSEWNEVEDEISAARRYFNAAATDYNNTVEMFPTNIVAGWMKYKEHPLFAIPEAERANVNARTLFNS